MSMRRLRLAGIGCGGRTATYLGLAAQMPEYYEVVAAADPIADRVDRIRALSNNPTFLGFSSDKELLAQGNIADVMIIGTQDAYHVEPCLAAMRLGYDILLEKPIATTVREVLALEQEVERLGRRVLVCHVLRYAPFYRKVKEIVDSGRLGTIVSVNAIEGVGAWHQAHSYVRGHWAVTQKATPMIVAKSCHDMDLLSWIIDRPCRSVSSSGSLLFFNAASAPDNAPGRCTDGCQAGIECPYNALLYLTDHRPWLRHVYDHDHNGTASAAQIREWLKTSPWGRCVYHCDNTAVDHQTAAFSFDGGVTATFTMTAFSQGRTLEIFGTKGRLVGGEGYSQSMGADLVVIDHHNGGYERITVPTMVGGYGGHGGGDPGLVTALYTQMTSVAPHTMLSSISRSVESHVMGFAAEEARLTGTTIDLDSFRRSFAA